MCQTLFIFSSNMMTAITNFFNNILILTWLIFQQSCDKNATHVITPCLSHEYQCRDRITCLHHSWLCDGEKDCPHGDDELQENCRNSTCRPDQFQCGDRSCIAGHLTCNGQADCADRSDEQMCGKLKIIVNVYK